MVPNRAPSDQVNRVMSVAHR